MTTGNSAVAAAARPRNFGAMRADRVVAMAAAHFGRAFAGKAEAMASLSQLPPAVQQGLKKPASGKAATGARRPSRFNNELRGGIAPPSADKLAAAGDKTVLRYLRATTGLGAKSKAQAFTLLAKFAPTDVARSAGAALDLSGLRQRGPSKAALRADFARLTGAPAVRKATSKELTAAIAAASKKISAGMSAAAPPASRAAVTGAQQMSSRLLAGMSAAGKASKAGLLLAFAAAAASNFLSPSAAEAKDMATKKSDTATARARAREQEAKAKTAEAEASARKAEADARARQAEADAKAREAATAAETEKTRLAAAQDQARRQALEDARPTQVTSMLLAPVAGIAAGFGLSHLIDKRASQTMAARAEQLKDLAGQAAKAGKGKAAADAAKISARGMVAAADKLKLGSVKGPLGLTIAATLLAEAALTRFVASPALADSPKAKAIADGVATASVFAATTMLGERGMHNAAPKTLPSARALAVIETARADLANGAKPPKAPKPPAGPSPRAAMAAQFEKVTGEAAKGVKPSTMRATLSAAESLKSMARGAGRAAPALAVAALAAGALSLLSSRSAMAKPAAGPPGPAAGPRAYLNDAAAAKAQAVPSSSAPMPAALARPAAAGQRPDGFADAYTRRGRNGQTVQVTGYKVNR